MMAIEGRPCCEFLASHQSLTSHSTCLYELVVVIVVLLLISTFTLITLALSYVSCSLKTLDRKKQNQFRGAHPVRYQADVVSLASTIRSKSNNPNNLTGGP